MHALVISMPATQCAYYTLLLLQLQDHASNPFLLFLSIQTAAAKSPGGKDYMLTLPGISAPLGFFDPLKFTDSPTFTVSEAKRYREAELTHGRVAMLAAVGWVSILF